MRTSRTIAIAAISSLTALAALGGAVSLGTSASADTDGIHLQAHQDLGLTVIPCDNCILHPFGFSPGAHIGEFLVDHGTLTDHTGKTVGHYGGQIVGTTVATNGPPEVQLTATLSLPEGQITVQGLEEPPADGGTIAITGGTGRYQGAKGELRFHDTGPTTIDMTIRLR